MKRITPEDVVDAFIATGRCRSPGRYVEGNCGACALGAVAISQGIAVYHRPLEYAHIAKALSLESAYCLDFSAGFESDLCPRPARQDSIGYQDGLAAQRAVTAHFAKASEQPQEAATCGTP